MSAVPPAARPPRRRASRVARIAAYVGIGALAVLAASLVALHTSPVRRIVLSRVAEALRAQNIAFTTSDLDYNLLEARLSLRDVVIRSAAAPDLPPFVSIDRVQLDVGLMALLRGRYVLEAGSAFGVRIQYLIAEDGTDNLPRPPRDPARPSEPLDYLVDEFHLRDAAISYEDRSRHLEVLLPVGSLDVDGHPLTDRHEVTIDSRGGHLVASGRRIGIDSLTAALDAGEDDLRLESVQLDADGAHAQLAGAIADFSNPRLDLTLDASVDAARAASVADLGETLDGTVRARAEIDGPASQPRVSGRISGRELQFRTLAGMTFDAQAEYAPEAALVHISTLRAEAAGGRIQGQGVIALRTSGQSQIRLDARNLNVGPVMRALDTPIAVASRLDARLRAQWPGLDYLALTGTGRVSLAPSLPGAEEGMLPVSGQIDITAADNRVEARLRRVDAASAVLDGHVRLVNRERLAGRVDVRVDDIARLMSAVARALERPADGMPVSVAGQAGGLVVLSGTTSAPAATAHLSAPSLRIGEASALALEADLTYLPSRVDVQQLTVAWKQAQLFATGTIALEGAQPMDLRVTSAGLSIAEIAAAAGRATLPVSGILAMDGRIEGTAERPAASLLLRGQDLAVYGEELGTLTSRVNVLGRRLVIGDLVIEKPQPGGDGRITGSGQYVLDRQAYRLDLRTEGVRLVGLALPDGRQLRGEIELTARGQGTMHEPTVTIALRAQDLRLDDHALGELSLDTTLAGRVARLALDAPTFGVTARATLGIDAPYPATADIQIADLPLADLPLELEAPLEGHVTATLALSGDLEQPRRGTATATINEAEVRWNEQPFRIDPPAVVRYASERVALDHLRIRGEDSIAVLSGEMPLAAEVAEGAIAVDLHADLATVARYAPPDVGLSASGALTLTGVVRGSFQAIDPSLSLAIANASVSAPALGPGLSNVTVVASVADGEAQLERLDAQFGTALVTASGSLPLDVLPDLPIRLPRPGSAATFTARIDGLDLASLPGAPERLDGRLTVAAAISAPRADLDAVDGTVAFEELELAFDGLTLAQGAPSRIVLDSGMVRVETFRLEGSVGAIEARGTVGLSGERPLDLEVVGTLDVAAASTLTEALRTDGTASIDIDARGTLQAPELSGLVELSGGTVAVDEPTLVAQNLALRLELAGPRVTLTTLTADFNGGRLEGSGFAVLGDGGLADLSLEIAARDVANDFPLDLRSLSDSTIRIVQRDDVLAIDAQVTIEEAGLTGDVNFDEGLLATIGARRRLDLTEPRNPLLERMRFNINVDTATPVVVDNNVARAEVVTDLRVIGTPYALGLAGRLDVLEGGEIILNERRYLVERGTITFIGEREIIPSFDLELHTTADDYDIVVAVSGTPGQTETTLASVPALPEPDIMSLLVTGRTLEEMRGQEFQIAQEQVLSYLAGRVGSQLGRGLEEATGLSTVRIEPNLIANEANPTARLTLGQDITSDLELIYSVDLTNSSDQIWIAEYDVTRRFRATTVRQSDDSYRFDFQHDVRFGGLPSPDRVPRERPRIASVTIESDGALAESSLRRLFGVQPGERRDYFELRDRADAVLETLLARGYLQARVRLDRQRQDSALALTLHVAAGPRVELVFSGAAPPDEVVERLRRQWQRGVFDPQRLDDGEEVLRGWLMAENHLQATVTGAIERDAPDLRRVRFAIEPGPRYARVRLEFLGASAIGPDELRDIVQSQDLELAVFTDPVQVTELIERYYGEQGYLVAAVDTPRYSFEGSEARVVLEVSEGPLFLIDEITISGNAAFPAPELLEELAIQPGQPFLPFAAENALGQIRRLYWSLGFNTVRPDYALELDREAGRVDVRLSVVEGPQSIVAGVDVTGTRATSERLVLDQVALAPGEPLDLQELARSRASLYRTGAFSMVDITREELAPEDSRQPVRLTVSVREVQPLQLRYGASWDTERGLGGILDVSSYNTLGSARVTGVRTRYDGQVREIRGYFHQPALEAWPVDTVASIYSRDERNPKTELAGGFAIDRRGASLQQERRLRNTYVWTYGVRYERARTFDPLGGALDERVTVTPLNSTFTRDTRDEVLDATQGTFSSHAFEYSPSWLGADDAYIKYFGQYFHYFPLQPVRRERFTGELLRPRLVAAAGVRIGLARGFGVGLPRSERFFAGGSTTLRGVAQNALGPIGTDGIPQGGHALLVINGELRFPLVGMFDGVVFSDVGNVFPLVSDISLSSLRETAGVGLRVRTPWFLLRGDYGVLLDRRPGERRSRFYFSIGQAF